MPNSLKGNSSWMNHTLEGIEKETLRKTNVILIPRNTALPAVCTEKFTTKRPGQRSIVKLSVAAAILPNAQPDPQHRHDKQTSGDQLNRRR